MQGSFKSFKCLQRDFNIWCQECDYKNNFETSNKTFEQENASSRLSYDVNRRVVQTFNSLGKGHRGLEPFSMSMNMKPMSCNAYYQHMRQMEKQYIKTTNESLEKARTAVRKAYSFINNTDLDDHGTINISVSFDGSWQKRGFTSKNGVGCCIDVITGLVVDYEVLSKYCRVCDKMQLGSGTDRFQAWFERHNPNWQKNNDGSSPSMETDAAERIWKRSEVHGFRYTTLVSDGDSKTFSHFTDLNLYETPIEKEECLNHVAMRLGTGLRKNVSENTGKGKTLGGKSYGSLN